MCSRCDADEFATKADFVSAVAHIDAVAGEARDALKNVPKETASTSDRVKHALEMLGKSESRSA